MTLEEKIDDFILEVLEKNQWIRRRAASELGISVRTLRYRIRAIQSRGHCVRLSPYRGGNFEYMQRCQAVDRANISS